MTQFALSHPLALLAFDALSISALVRRWRLRRGKLRDTLAIGQQLGRFCR